MDGRGQLFCLFLFIFSYLWAVLNSPGCKFGGARRNRTDDLFNAIEALSQLSYGPNFAIRFIIRLGRIMSAALRPRRRLKISAGERCCIAASPQSHKRKIMSQRSWLLVVLAVVVNEIADVPVFLFLFEKGVVGHFDLDVLVTGHGELVGVGVSVLE